MFETKPYTPKISLIDINGNVVQSWNTLVRCAKGLPNFLGVPHLYQAFEYIGSPNHRVYSRAWHYSHADKLSDMVILPYILKNEYGENISKKELSDALRALEKQVKEQYYFNGYRRHFYHTYFRKPKTISARSDAEFFIEEEGELPVRACRGKGYLPSSWDDVYKHTEKNWKRHRKTQWKAK